MASPQTIPQVVEVDEARAPPVSGLVRVLSCYNFALAEISQSLTSPLAGWFRFNGERVFSWATSVHASPMKSASPKAPRWLALFLICHNIHSNPQASFFDLGRCRVQDRRAKSCERIEKDS